MEAANTRIKELYVGLHSTKADLVNLQGANESLKERDHELRESFTRIQQLVEVLSGENSALKEKNASFVMARECIEDRSRELESLLSAAMSERDMAYSQREEAMSTFDKLQQERDAAINEKNVFSGKLDKIASDFEADYETVRSRIDTLIVEKKDLQSKITFLEASKASVEDNADRILQRDNTLGGQHDRLKSSFKKQSMKVAELQGEVGQLTNKVSSLKDENGRLTRDNCALKDMLKTSKSKENEPTHHDRKRAVFGFLGNKAR